MYESGINEEIRIRREGQLVLILKDGVLMAAMPYGAALDVAVALRHTALQAQAVANPQPIIDDQAIIAGAGFPIGILPASIVTKATPEVYKKCGGIPSGSQVGTPSIHRQFGDPSWLTKSKAGKKRDP